MMQSFVLVALLASFAARVASHGTLFIPPRTHIDYDMRTDEHGSIYDTVIEPTLRAEGAAASYTPPYFQCSNGELRYMLGPRRPDFSATPSTWMELHLTFGDAPHEQTTLAVATDDLSLLGFQNGTGHYFVFDGGFQGLPDAIVLPFSLNYRELTHGGSYRDLWRYPLGNESAVASARVLASCDLSRVPEHALTDAVLKLMIMFAEGFRLKAIRDAFSGRMWSQETYLSPRQASYTGGWGKMSGLLVKWYRTGEWGGGGLQDAAEMVAHEDGITCAGQALEIIGFVLRPRPDDEVYLVS